MSVTAMTPEPHASFAQRIRGLPVPLENEDFRTYADAVIEASRAAYAAAKSKGMDAMIAASGVVADACTSATKAVATSRRAKCVAFETEGHANGNTPSEAASISAQRCSSILRIPQSLHVGVRESLCVERGTVILELCGVCVRRRARRQRAARHSRRPVCGSVPIADLDWAACRPTTTAGARTY